jgi:hypothetical protein
LAAKKEEGLIHQEKKTAGCKLRNPENLPVIGKSVETENP